MKAGPTEAEEETDVPNERLGFDVSEARTIGERER